MVAIPFGQFPIGTPTKSVVRFILSGVAIPFGQFPIGTQDPRRTHSSSEVAIPFGQFPIGTAVLGNHHSVRTYGDESGDEAKEYAYQAGTPPYDPDSNSVLQVDGEVASLRG